MSAARWIDLLDPSREELVASLPDDIDPEAVESLASPPGIAHEPRPMLEAYDGCVVGIFLDARPVPDEDRISYREVAVVATPELVVTARKTPEDGRPWDPAPLAACKGASAGELLFRLVDDVAESFIDVVDTAYAEIDELEDHLEDWPSVQVRRRLSSLRHDLLHARRTVSSTRSAVRRVVDKRLEIGEEELFPERVERMFADTYETLFRAGEELDVARDLLSSSRDFHQAMVAENQNEVVKKLTVIASLLLLPTLVVGFYGQNFPRAFNDFYWSIGISALIIVGSTLVQLALFRWRRWI
jgi:magnesium transporter